MTAALASHRGDAAGAPAWRAAPPPLAVLRACGWLAAELPDDALRVDRADSSHTVFRVCAPDGRSVVVKQLSRQAARQGRSLHHELFVYRLAAWMPEIGAIVPRPVFLDEHRQVVAVDSVSSAGAWPDPAVTVRLDRTRAAAATARLLATLHRATADIGLAPTMAAGVLGMVEDVNVAARGRDPACADLMRAIVADPALAAVLREGLAGYRISCLIHGDVRPENVVRSRCGLRLIDWEIAGAGDPLWDLASLVAEVARVPLLGGRIGRDAWPRRACPATGAALRAYHEAGGPFDAADAAACRRLALFAAARMLHGATEAAEYGGRADGPPVTALLTAARDIALDPAAAAAALGRAAARARR